MKSKIFDRATLISGRSWRMDAVSVDNVSDSHCRPEAFESCVATTSPVWKPDVAGLAFPSHPGTTLAQERVANSAVDHALVKDHQRAQTEDGPDRRTCFRV